MQTKKTTNLLTRGYERKVEKGIDSAFIESIQDRKESTRFKVRRNRRRSQIAKQSRKVNRN